MTMSESCASIERQCKPAGDGPAADTTFPLGRVFQARLRRLCLEADEVVHPADVCLASDGGVLEVRAGPVDPERIERVSEQFVDLLAAVGEDVPSVLPPDAVPLSVVGCDSAAIAVD